MKYTKAYISLVGLCAALLLAPAIANAAFVITDPSGRVTIGGDEDSGELTTWDFQGLDHLFDGGIRFRTGDEEERSLDTFFTGATVTASSIVLDYSITGLFDLSLAYSVSSPFASRAILNQSISIFNSSGGPLDLNLFQYWDFDLNDDFLSDTLTREAENRVSQESGDTALDGFIDMAAVLGHGDVANVTELAFFPDLANRLNFFPFNDPDGPTNLTNTPIGFGIFDDPSWAWQWHIEDFAAGAHFESDLRYVMDIPEPGSLILLGVGFAGGFLARRRRPTTSR